MVSYRAELRAHGVSGLLSDPDSNPKLAKNIGMNALTAPLHLAPHKLSGFNTCPMATKGCIKACLHTAGNPAFMSGKERARIARTKLFFSDRALFMTALVEEIAKHEHAALSTGMISGVRLNATSDIRWETIGVLRNGIAFTSIMDAFPHTSFYDYTKIANRKGLPRNYKLTFSLADGNETSAALALKNGMNVAAVYAVTPKQALPDFDQIGGRLYPVINGDEHDFRPIDPRGVIVGLRAKGKARGDTSGFVRTPMYGLEPQA